MLVLSRKAGQRVVIDANIGVVVAEIRGNKVRLAIKAPDDVANFREEVCRRSIERNSPADGFHESQDPVAERRAPACSPASPQLSSSHTI